MKATQSTAQRRNRIHVGLIAIPLLSSCAVRDSMLSSIGSATHAIMPGSRPSVQSPPMELAPNLQSAQVTPVSHVSLIEKGGEDGSASLRSALLSSGIPVRLDSGFLVPSAIPQAESPWDSWQVDATVSAMKIRSTIKLSEAGDIIAKYTLPPSTPGTFGQLLIDGVQEAAKSQSPTDRFWAKFVDAIGGEDSLLGDEGGPDRRITNVQLALILNRVAGRLQAVSVSGAALTPGSRQDFARPYEPNGRRAAVRFVQSGKSPSLPGCYYGTGQAEGAPDAAALLQTSIFTSLMEYLKEHVRLPGELETVEKVGLGADLINVLAAAAKLAIVTWMTDINVVMSGDGPLVRTKHTQEFEQKRVLRAEMSSNTGNLQFLSCFRLAMNTVGIDVDIPKDGPVGGAIIQWRLLKGGISGATLDPKERIVDFFQTPKSKQEVRESRDAAFLSNFVSNSRTDEEGRAEIGVEGYPQKEEISDKASPLHKEISVLLDVAYERQSLLKAGVSGAGVAIAGPVAGSPIAVLTTIVPELFLGSRWKHSRVFSFPVIDWGSSGYRFDGSFTIHSHGWSLSKTGLNSWSGTIGIADGLVCPESSLDGLWGMAELGSGMVELTLNGHTGRLPPLTGAPVFKPTGMPPDPGGKRGDLSLVMLDGDPPRLEFRYVMSQPASSLEHFESDGPKIVPLRPTDDCSSRKDIPSSIPQP